MACRAEGGPTTLPLLRGLSLSSSITFLSGILGVWAVLLISLGRMLKGILRYSKRSFVPGVVKKPIRVHGG